MIGPLGRTIEREMLFDHGRSHHIGNRRHRNAVVMGGEPDHNVRETFAESLDHLQVQLVELGRITRGALQDAKLRIDRHYGAIGAHHVIHRGAAARDDHRLAELGDMAQQRQIDDISRSDLVSRHIECFEEVRARNIESRGEEGYADLFRMRDQFEMLFRW